jgi:hypothetical protein
MDDRVTSGTPYQFEFRGLRAADKEYRHRPLVESTEVAACSIVPPDTATEFRSDSVDLASRHIDRRPISETRLVRHIRWNQLSSR